MVLLYPDRRSCQYHIKKIGDFLNRHRLVQLNPTAAQSGLPQQTVDNSSILFGLYAGFEFVPGEYGKAGWLRIIALFP